MPDWNSNLSVVWLDAAGTEHVISPIQSFTPTFALRYEPLHSIEHTHIGTVYSPHQFTFAMTVNALGPAVAQLTVLALQHTQFKVMMREVGAGLDWSFATVVMDRCIITSAVPSTATTAASSPLATFSGFSLSAASTPKGGTETKIP
ncbi:MAG TPA: hypothetical protein VF520_13425 [Thermoleophilaceae bacterium]|jgi:hypothetical protein